jgi:excisionase family DNA binding protein
MSRMVQLKLARPRLNGADEMLKTRAGDVVGTNVEPLSVDISGACRMTGLGRSKIYELLGSGELRSLKVGRRRIITVGAIRELLARLESNQTA